jgi:hypothetical protein
MDTQPAFTVQDLLTYIIGEIANAVCQREGESQDQRAQRLQAAIHTMLAFSPRDPLEAILAGRCVMFHELTLDSIRGTLRGETEATRRATRSGIVGMDRAFGANLARLERRQNRAAQPAPSARPKEALDETDIIDRVRRHQAHDAGQPETSFAPSPELIAACAANPEVIAAFDAADPVRFLRAMGMDNPKPEYLAAAAAQMAEFKQLTAEHERPPETPRFANRQQRRHPNR